METQTGQTGLRESESGSTSPPPPAAATLRLACELALEYLESLPTRPVGERATLGELRARLGVSLDDEGVEPSQVLRELAAGAEPGLVGSAGPRYFGFVIGGSLPAALGADWLTSTWDQNPGLYAVSPAAAVVEEIAAAWILDLLGLPAGASVGFVTGCQMAHVTALAAARHALLARLGWDVGERGLSGAPPLRILAGSEAHVTVFRALRLLGLGTHDVERVESDGQGRMEPAALARRLAAGRAAPALICAQVGNVNTGACDPLADIAALARQHGAWLHVDGAFGLWAAASPRLRHLVAGAVLADSWATDAHKWLNVPYDSGIVAVADTGAHSAAMSTTASYLQQHEGRDALDWVPEFSRRARGFAVYAALRSLGRRGVGELVERCCEHARQMAEILAAESGVEVLNEVVLNQVLVRFHVGSGAAASLSSDELTRAVIRRVQRQGVCWLGGTTWHGMAAMRISVSNWSTSRDDAELSAAAILAAMREEMAGRR
ncbi:MAG TPA: aminotransferase class V-fold PLP-dependent enzyme [Thermoanaerobaculia bacterium]|jgi:glutamate/tyrosine decarboxylase-like PLP-dependent enzyme|nr:aminotransferase class V-fold PLP-dependent enzyme [Thermoanaerobaculia bacterium]